LLKAAASRWGKSARKQSVGSPTDPKDGSSSQLPLPLGDQQTDEEKDAALREWITQLWFQHQPMLREMAHFHLGDWDRAQEVVQDTWVDFQKSLGRFEGRCSPKTWLVQILRRRLKKELRGAILRRAREALLGISKVRHYDEYDARAAPFVNRGENPEKALLMQECLEYILRVGRALPKRQAEVWILTDLFEWTGEEVSTALAISPEYQRVLLHRAHQRLRLELKRYLGDLSASSSQ
jgi:RNA polymerase sigma-70 factor (ECF subfamily)